MHSPQLLELLRAWWLQCPSKGWLFTGHDPLLPLTVRQLNRSVLYQRVPKLFGDLAQPSMACGVKSELSMSARVVMSRL